MNLRTLFMAAAIAAIATPAIAGGNTCIGNANCSTTNNDNDPITNTANGGAGGTAIGTNTNVNTAVGGTGGKGGEGGDALNFNANVAKGGDATVKNSGNSFNVNVNDNDQSQSTSVRTSTKQKQDQSQTQVQSSYSKSKVEDSGNSSVYIEGDEYRRQTPSAFAPALWAAPESCVQSQTAGGSSPVFGFSLGITHDNEGCDMRRNAAVLVMLGRQQAAVELMCSDDDVRDAMRNAGTPCAADRPAPAPVAMTEPASERVAFVPMAPVE